MTSKEDPLDPKTARHAPECEFASSTDAAVLRVILKVRDGIGGDYWWVECGARDTAWAGSVLPRGECPVTEDLGVCGRRAAN